ncbi:hypothetical protein [Yersinia canariae]|uniref:hypothetical protein n=1 Tax=Yersinia canariae TaxID=2607663 RepID=UPI0011A32767|nr:hypothetical protein [Yersinia canariae]
MSNALGISHSIHSKIALFNHLSSQSKQSDTKPAGSKLAHKLIGLSNTITPQPSAVKKITFHSIQKNNTSPKVSLFKTDNKEKALSSVAKMMINKIMAGLPQIKGQTAVDRYALALNQYQRHTNKIEAVKISTAMPTIPRAENTVLPPSPPIAAVKLNLDVKSGGIPLPPPLPLDPVVTQYVRQEVKPASRQELEQNAAEQRSKTAKKDPVKNPYRSENSESVIAELKQRLAARNMQG